MTGQALAKKIFSLGGRFARDDMPWRKIFSALAKIFPRATKA